MTLSPKHIQVRDFILQYQTEHNERPGVKIIQSECGIRSTATVWEIIDQLKKAKELIGPLFVPAKAKTASDLA